MRLVTGLSPAQGQSPTCLLALSLCLGPPESKAMARVRGTAEAPQRAKRSPNQSWNPRAAAGDVIRHRRGDAKTSSRMIPGGPGSGCSPPLHHERSLLPSAAGPGTHNVPHSATCCWGMCHCPRQPGPQAPPPPTPSRASRPGALGGYGGPWETAFIRKRNERSGSACAVSTRATRASVTTHHPAR